MSNAEVVAGLMDGTLDVLVGPTGVNETVILRGQRGVVESGTWTMDGFTVEWYEVKR